MNKKRKSIIIFGDGEIAKLAFFFFQNYSEYSIAGFVTDKEHNKNEIFLNLPIINIEDVVKMFPPCSYQAFIAISYNKQNSLREEKFLKFKSLDYNLTSFIHPSATIAKNVEIGENCMLLENQVIQPYVKIKDNVVIWSGCHIGHGTTIDVHCWLTSHVVISGNVYIGKRSFLGVNSCIRDNINIGSDVMIGMGANVTKSIESGNVIISNNSVNFKKGSKQAEFIKKKYFNL